MNLKVFFFILKHIGIKKKNKAETEQKKMASKATIQKEKVKKSVWIIIEETKEFKSWETLPGYTTQEIAIQTWLDQRFSREEQEEPDEGYEALLNEYG